MRAHGASVDRTPTGTRPVGPVPAYCASAAIKKTKTRRKRTIDIEPNLLPLVRALVQNPQGKNGRLVHMPPPEDRAELLRKDLRTVGVLRSALFIEKDPVERALTFHDLRDTGLTHMAVRGDSPIVIQWAGGHSDFKTTQEYVDRGKVEARRIGRPLPPLPAELLRDTAEAGKNIAPESPGTISNFVSSRSHSRSGVTPTGIEAADEISPNALEKAAADSDRIPATSETARVPAPSSEPEPVRSSESQLTDVELEGAIVRAVTAGVFDVARVLASQLEERRRARVPANVVDFDAAKRRR